MPIVEYFVLAADPDRFDCLVLPPGGDYTVFSAFDGRPLAATWRPVRVEVLEVGRSGDFPYLAASVPVLAERAWVALKPLLSHDVEALPLIVGAERYRALNVRAVLDCLDVDASDGERWDSGRIASLERYVLKPGCPNSHDIFKLRRLEDAAPLVSTHFRDAVNKSGLKGFMFKEIG